jgi:LPS O-antigen subunit length determinant protein (WzzB/FepE family)
MANQSLVSVPPNVGEPVVLQRFLSRLVEQLDIVLGNRAGPKDSYVSQDELLKSAEDVVKELDNARDLLQQTIDQVGELSEEALLDLTKRINAIDAKNVEQDTEIEDIKLVDNTQNNRLTNLENAGYIADAPSDGNTYARKDGAWVTV